MGVKGGGLCPRVRSRGAVAGLGNEIKCFATWCACGGSGPQMPVKDNTEASLPMIGKHSPQALAPRLRPSVLLRCAVAGSGVRASAQGVQSEPLPEVKAPAQKAPKPSPQTTGCQRGVASAGWRRSGAAAEGRAARGAAGRSSGRHRHSRIAGAVRRASAAASVGSSGPMSGSDEARLDSMETQIRALTAQIEQLSSDVRAGAGRRSEAAGARSLRRQWFGSVERTLRRVRASSGRRRSHPIRPIPSAASLPRIR